MTMRDVAKFGLKKLVIFDCDGVVVDSEVIAAQVLQESLATAGVSLARDEVIDLFLGRSAASIRQILKDQFGFDLSTDREETNLARLLSLFRTDLRPIAGVADLLAKLHMPYCLASSSDIQRLEVALTSTGLFQHFDGRIFNAAMVKNGKPSPDLFLLAARHMQVSPADCLVIEDSPAGVLAAKSAGMHVIAFIGGGHAGGSRLRQRLLEQNPDAIVSDMTEIEAMIL